MVDTNLENAELLSVKERLIIFIEYEKLSQSKFEKIVGLSNGYVNNIKNSISDKVFDTRIQPAFPYLNKIWILHGLGDMIKKTDSEEKNNSSTSIKNKPHDEQMAMLFSKIEKLETKIQIYQERDRLYLKAIIEHLGINDEKLDEEFEKIKENSNSN